MSSFRGRILKIEYIHQKNDFDIQIQRALQLQDQLIDEELFQCICGDVRCTKRNGSIDN